MPSLFARRGFTSQRLKNKGQLRLLKDLTSENIYFFWNEGKEPDFELTKPTTGQEGYKPKSPLGLPAYR
jgi:hypothetical protein